MAYEKSQRLPVVGVPGFRVHFRHFFFHFFQEYFLKIVVIIKISNIFTKTIMHALTKILFLNIFHTDTLIFYGFSDHLFSVCATNCSISSLLLHTSNSITDICVKMKLQYRKKSQQLYGQILDLFGVMHSLILAMPHLAKRKENLATLLLPTLQHHVIIFLLKSLYYCLIV